MEGVIENFELASSLLDYDALHMREILDNLAGLAAQREACAEAMGKITKSLDNYYHLLRNQNRFPSACARLEALRDTYQRMETAERTLSQQMIARVCQPLDIFMAKDFSKALESKKRFTGVRNKYTLAMQIYSSQLSVGSSTPPISASEREEFEKGAREALSGLASANAGVMAHIALLCVHSRTLLGAHSSSCQASVELLDTEKLALREAQLSAEDKDKKKKDPSAVLMEELLVSERKCITVIGNLAAFSNQVQGDISIGVGNDQCKELFGPVAELSALHTRSLPKLETVSMAGDQLKAGLLADFILDTVPQWRGLYQPMLKNESKAIASVSALQSKPTFSKIFDRICSVIDFQSLRAAPYTHLFDYQNTLKELEKTFKESTAIPKNVRDALIAMDNLFQTLQMARDASKSMQELLSIAESVFGLEDIVVEDRKLIQQGEVFLLTEDMPDPPSPGSAPSSPRDLLSTSGSSPAKRVRSSTLRASKMNNRFLMYLMNDMLALVNSPSKGKKALYMRIPLRSLAVSQVIKTTNNLYLSWGSGPGCGFTVSLNSFAERDMWYSKIMGAVQELKKSQVFGKDLTELLENEKETGLPYPRFVQTVCTYILEKGLLVDGIFRVSSSLDRLKLLQEAVDRGKLPEFMTPWEAASLLKLWLKSLPKSLLDEDLFSEWVAAAESLGALREVSKKLTTANRRTAKEIFKVLKAVAGHSDENLMTSQNLAIVIALTVLQGGKDMGFTPPPLLFTAVENLIEHPDEIFAD